MVESEKENGADKGLIFNKKVAEMIINVLRRSNEQKVITDDQLLALLMQFAFSDEKGEVMLDDEKVIYDDLSIPTVYDDLSVNGFIMHKHALSDGSDLTHPTELADRCIICSYESTIIENPIVSEDELNPNRAKKVS